jgi:MOSC domain-containing protein YiiM
MPGARIISINIVHALIVDPVGDVGRTAIDKRPVPGPVVVQTLGLVGDTSLDRKYHGGRDQAVYAYAGEDQAGWEAELGRPVPPGSFGENLTTEGLDVTGAVVGERWQVEGADGSPPVLLEVTAPRIPCATFQAFTGEPHWVRRFTERGAPGAYLRVLGEGRITAGASVEVVERPAHGVTIGEVFVLRHADPDRLARLLAEGDDLHVPLAAAIESQLRRGSAPGQSLVNKNDPTRPKPKED